MEEKRVMAATKLRTFETALKQMVLGRRIGEAKQSQIANTKNMAPRENRVYFDNFVKGDNVSSEKDAISRRNRGRKKSNVYCVAALEGMFCP